MIYRLSSIIGRVILIQESPQRTNGLEESKSQECMQDVKPHRHFWTVPENAKMGMKSLRLPSPPTGESNIGSPRFLSRILTVCNINRCEEVVFCFLFFCKSQAKPGLVTNNDKIIFEINATRKGRTR